MEIYKPILTQYETSQHLYDDAQKLMVDWINQTIAESGIARLALSGGETPFPLYSRLAVDPSLEWSSIELYQTDERYLAGSNQDSNQRKIKEAFGPEVIIELREANFFNTEYPIDLAASDYSQKLDTLDGTLFDVSIVGIGPDGHLASLFPNSNYLKHQAAKAIVTQAPEQFKAKQRLSLTIESVLSTELMIVLLKGETKKDIVTELLEGKMSASEFPAKFLLAHPNLHIFHSLED